MGADLVADALGARSIRIEDTDEVEAIGEREEHARMAAPHRPDADDRRAMSSRRSARHGWGGGLP
jgi:hypothetical protein